MNFTVKLLIVVGVAWAALSPPLFTGGDCTAEFEAESTKLNGSGQSLRSSEQAREYWSERGIPFSVLNPEACRKRKPRTLDRCGDGPLVIAQVPMKNPICRIYRDDEITVWLHYDARDRLTRFQMDMKPYKSLPIPGTGQAIHWAR